MVLNYCGRRIPEAYPFSTVFPDCTRQLITPLAGEAGRVFEKIGIRPR